MLINSNNTLIIIPARGGSKGIPRKNLRLLDGRPLITYVIKTALKIQDAVIVVSTEDEEIAEIASQWGATVIIRPPELAEDHITLDSVVIHAWQEAEKKYGVNFEKIVTLQPTSPLLSRETLENALREIDKKELDCCITVSDARHLYWIEENGEPVPLYKARLNRQWLPPIWKETGVVVTKRKMLVQGVRIGGRIGLLSIPEDEAIDIDNYEDWFIVEKKLTSPKVAIRVKGNSIIGLGHAYRMLSIALRLFVSNIKFFVDEDSDLAAQLIERFNFPVTKITGESDFIQLIRREGFDLIINDVLDTSSEYIRDLKGNNERVVINFEDLGSGGQIADLTINALYEYSTPAPNQRFGWRFACLREEFLTTKPRPFDSNTDKTILITFGGTDPNDLTSRAIFGCTNAAMTIGKKFNLIH